MNHSSAGRRILLLHNELTSTPTLTSALEKAGFQVMEGHLPELALHELVHDPPCLVLAAEGTNGHSVETLTRNLKLDAFLGRLPLIVFVRDSRLNDIDWGSLGVDDFITVPYRAEDVVHRIRLCLSRLTRSLDANPLTRLPGNTTILCETTARIQSRQPFALAYLDIDNFKSFNDRYGYGRGDEVLIVACRILTTVVGELAGSEGFVGHVGGDDFVFMSRPDTIDAICETIIKRFDLVIPDFYDREDRLKGYIDSVDRRGNKEQFPIMSLSIAVVTNEQVPIAHPGDVSKIASELKKKAKAIKGSVYVKDQRGQVVEIPYETTDPTKILTEQ
ncbi:putative CheY-like response regulator modulated diguanylate cyclase [Candidatus Nitrospira nitrosa]|uniref:diguanylate cyclase n=1 Tax=Candidatus Nitrospira nitrosa TaxID=1742972 RepID=A0A0S4LCD9_9BACT|nr:diguanylate cyclase [Candidatus Nitrospira nitrosa]CUS35393.1 putative CheY-like response regulator modulated diguanylate cyclase [Candidatus Nitrospira nitrosa]